jgi:hypothetical protein
MRWADRAAGMLLPLKPLSDVTEDARPSACLGSVRSRRARRLSHSKTGSLDGRCWWRVEARRQRPKPGGVAFSTRLGSTMQHVFVERLLEQTESERRLPLGVRYDEHLDRSVWADGSPLLNAHPGLAETDGVAMRDPVELMRNKTTRADRDRPRVRRLRAWKKTGADKDKPKVRGLRFSKGASTRQRFPQVQSTNSGDG